jgi:hypothetical protein
LTGGVPKILEDFHRLLDALLADIASIRQYRSEDPYLFRWIDATERTPGLL